MASCVESRVIWCLLHWLALVIAKTCVIGGVGGSSDSLARSIALSSDGSLLVVGSDGYDNGNGAVNITAGSGGETSRLNGAGKFGYAISFSSATMMLAVGAPLFVGGGGVHVFSGCTASGMCTSESLLSHSDSSTFGRRVAMSGDGSLLVVG